MIKITEIGDYLKKLRGKRSLREIERLSDVSHTYLSSIEKGVDPRSGNEIIPTPEVLKRLSYALDVDYEKLMEIAGHLEGKTKKQRKKVLLTGEIRESLDAHIRKILKILTLNGEFLDLIDEDIQHLEEEYAPVIDDEEGLTPEWLENLPQSIDIDANWIDDLLNSLYYIISKHNLQIDHVLEKRRNQELAHIDLVAAIKSDKIRYMGQELSPEDRQRILDMLKLLFSDRKGE